MPKIKETNYFSRDYIDPNYGFKIDSWERYNNLFPRVGCEYYGEVCPSYFYFPDALLSKHSDCDIKYIICLRDPLRRAISHYFMDLNRFKVELPVIAEALTDESLGYFAWNSDIEAFLGLSDYEFYLSKFQKSIDKNRLLILFFEEGMDRNRRKIFDFLDLPDTGFSAVVNAQKTARSRHLIKLARFPIVKTCYEALPSTLMDIAREIIYTKRVLGDYSNEKEVIFNSLCTEPVWVKRIEFYRMLQREYLGK